MRKTGQPPSVAGYEKTLANPRAPHGAKLDAARRLARTPTGYDVEQRVTFRRKVLVTADGAAGHTGVHVAPHIRRGHWRNVPYGPPAALPRPTRRTFIPEVFVNAHLFGTGGIRVVYS